MTSFTTHADLVYPSARFRTLAVALTVACALVLGIPTSAQEPAPPVPQPAQPASPAQPQQDNSAADVALETPAPLSHMSASALTEDQLRQLLVGKDLFLRGGYLGDSVSFTEDGMLSGHAPFGSYTLCAVRIDKVHLSKKKVEMVGARYGLHFLGALAYEDPTKAIDRVRITPKKKVLRLTVDRETVTKPKKAKEPKQPKGKGVKSGSDPVPNLAEVPQAQPPAPKPAEDKTDAATAPLEEPPSGKPGAKTTTSQTVADRLLIDSLNRVFATGIDDKMLAAMPKFWQLYYEAAAAKTDYRPADPQVLRQNMVDQKAKLLTNFEPGSNEFAQANGVAGMALYHVVIEADGKPGEIAVARPIGFGLDENAVDSIRKASFAPAQKDGKTVPVLLDLVVQFRIYSKRTSVAGTPDTPEKAAERKKPGPYTIQEQKASN